MEKVLCNDGHVHNSYHVENFDPDLVAESNKASNQAVGGFGFESRVGKVFSGIIHRYNWAGKLNSIDLWLSFSYLLTNDLNVKATH